MEQKTTGFASPAQGYEEETIDLNRLLIHNPPATYFGRLETDGMKTFGIPKGSLLIVDRSVSPFPNSFVLIRHEGEFLCRMLIKEKGKTAFTDGETFITPTPGETEIIGVITASIKVHFNAPWP
jgi:DNA polymerase V